MIGQPGGQRLPLPCLESNLDSWIHSWPRYQWTIATPYPIKRIGVPQQHVLLHGPWKPEFGWWKTLSEPAIIVSISFWMSLIKVSKSNYPMRDLRIRNQFIVIHGIIYFRIKNLSGIQIGQNQIYITYFMSNRICIEKRSFFQKANHWNAF